MNNIEKYQKVFKDAFGVSSEVLNEEFTYNSIPEWDSVGHMGMIASLEEEFSIMMETEDIIDFSSYLAGIKILKKYGVEM